MYHRCGTGAAHCPASVLSARCIPVGGCGVVHGKAHLLHLPGSLKSAIGKRCYLQVSAAEHTCVHAFLQLRAAAIIACYWSCRGVCGATDAATAPLADAL
eukprot:GHRQ01027821.1.p5 GENE.GHRQ01027821.1~~GHRQ01027821.1.p5  ORF type:complete len:100 (-),score=1.92 GHRQ01027821.1:579-878(-)